jgi:hypothetical protein
MEDYLDDFEEAAKDYAELGPMWAELVFPDDDDALRAIYGGRDTENNAYDDDYDDNRSRRR